MNSKNEKQISDGHSSVIPSTRNPKKINDEIGTANEAFEVDDVPLPSRAAQDLSGQDFRDADNKRNNKCMRWATGTFKMCALLSLLYTFLCTLEFLTIGFQLVAGRGAGDIFTGNELLSNPIVGLMMGVLFTVMVQSSSTCTSVIVSLVASGILTVEIAIPMVMGSNIGTSMTSTLVSLTQVADRDQFERAFAAATIHDCFNWLTVIILLVVEVTTSYLEVTSAAVVNAFHEDTGGNSNLKFDIIDVITDPICERVIQIDKKVLDCWSTGGCEEDRLLKTNCATSSVNKNDTINCNFVFYIPSWSDAAIGGLLLVLSLFLLSVVLILIVKVLRSALEGSMAKVVKRFVNADIPYVPWLTGYLAIIIGAVVTFCVQSSSVFTSTMTPLVGVGLITVERVYPLTLGSNIGTTSTAMLAALAAGDSHSVQVALCHLLFNLTGIGLFYPVPFTRLPLPMCKILGQTTAKYRWFAIFYLAIMFFIIPGFVLALSFAGNLALICVLAPTALVLATVVLINILQAKIPKCLPAFLRDWTFLPLCLHSLDPMDRLIQKMSCTTCCKNRTQTTFTKN